jgi:hypothetical protein
VKNLCPRTVALACMSCPPRFELITGCKLFAVWRSDRQLRDPDCKIWQLHRQFCPPLWGMYNSPNLLYSAPHFELIVGCKKSSQSGGAIHVAQGATCNIDGGTFLSNHAGAVSQQRKKPSLTLPFARKMLEIPARDFQPFLSLLTSPCNAARVERS